MILGMGSALVDLEVKVQDEEISKLGFVKGSMNLINEKQSQELISQFSSRIAKQQSGGSTANTIYGISKSSNYSCRLIGSVGKDPMGDFYAADLKANNIDFIENRGNLKTGICLVLVSEDAQRTMLTYLGSAPFINQEQISESSFDGVKYFLTEGYLWDNENTIAAVKKCIEIVKKKGIKFAFSASDFFCVDRHKDDFLNILKESDIFFANADEAKRLANTDSVDEAINSLSEKNNFLAITDGKEGANLIVNQKKYFFPSIPDIKLVDTTGAGDNFAAGVLSGIVQDKSIDETGKLGIDLAGKVIVKYGGRI